MIIYLFYVYIYVYTVYTHISTQSMFTIRGKRIGGKSSIRVRVKLPQTAVPNFFHCLHTEMQLFSCSFFVIMEDLQNSGSEC